MKHRFLFSLIAFPLALSSCSNGNHLGVYSFQMGKNSGSYVKASITLSNDDYVAQGVTLGKKMSVFGQVGGAFGGAYDSSNEQEEAEDMPIMDVIYATIAKGASINGYYHIGEQVDKGKNRLCLGFDLDFLNPILGEEGPSFQLDSALTELFVYSEIDSNHIYLNIPVSFHDLSLQLYWYGVDISWLSILDDLSSLEDELVDDSGDSIQSSAEYSSEEDTSSEDSSFPDPIDVESHPIGSKPSEADIEAINKTYPASHGGALYRTFYTVSVGLTRQ